MEVLYQLTPVMGITLLILSLAHEQLWDVLPGSPYFATFPRAVLTIAIIFCFALVAFCMVVAEFALIANTSALTFMVAGTFKEIVTGVCVGGWGRGRGKARDTLPSGGGVCGWCVLRSSTQACGASYEGLLDRSSSACACPAAALARALACTRQPPSNRP